VIRTVLHTSGGDLRRAITYLQSASRLSLSTSPPTPITSFEIEEIAGTVPEELIQRLGCELGAEQPGNAMDVDSTTRVKSFGQIKARVRSLIQSGYAATQILSQVSQRSLGSY
jgi:replication factor C subunit 2/4